MHVRATGGHHLVCQALYRQLLFIILISCSSIIGTKYDLDNKNPSRSGQNFKSGEDMIEMYKELCAGIWYTDQNVDGLPIIVFLLEQYKQVADTSIFPF